MRPVPLFIDTLDIWLQVLAWGLLAGAAWLLLRFWLTRDPNAIASYDRGFGYAFLGIGIFALVSGLWGAFTWPLPSSYNLVLEDPYVLYGIAYLILGLALIAGASLMGPTVTIAFMSITVFAYAADILKYHLTNSPAAAASMYILIALAALLSPLVAVRNQRLAKYIAIIEVVLLVLGGLLAAYIGIGATFEHTAGWMRWTPWYGTSTTSSGS